MNQQATPTNGLRSNSILTCTLTISALLLRVRLWNPLPSGVRYVTGSLTSVITPSAAYSVTTHDVVWEGHLLTNHVQVFVSGSRLG